MLARTKVCFPNLKGKRRWNADGKTDTDFKESGSRWPGSIGPAPKKRRHSDQWWWLSLRNETGSTAMYLLQDQYYCDREQSINHAKYIRSSESHAAHARKNDKIYQKCIAKRYTRYLQRCLIDSDKFTWLNATQTWSVGGRIRNSSSWLLVQFAEVVGLTNKFLQNGLVTGLIGSQARICWSPVCGTLSQPRTFLFLEKKDAIRVVDWKSWEISQILAAESDANKCALIFRTGLGNHEKLLISLQRSTLIACNTELD
jgi:hypothetical protein